MENIFETENKNIYTYDASSGEGGCSCGGTCACKSENNETGSCGGNCSCQQEA